MVNIYLCLFVLFLINNIIHQIPEKIVTILFIFLIFTLFTTLNNFLVSNYSQRITNLLYESHLYIDSLFLFLFLTAYTIFRTDCLLNSVSGHFTNMSKYLVNYYPNFSCLNSKPLFLFGLNIILPSYPIFLWLNEYVWIFSFMAGAFLISSALIFLSYVLVYQEADNEKSSAYECGFQPFEDARNKFNVKYYLVAILFMIFDLEIMYLFPWAISISVTGLFGVIVVSLFILILIAGFVYEWQQGALNWS